MMGYPVPKVYAVKHKSKDVVALSRSGGIFTALSDEVLSRQGIVYGCALTDDFKAVHIRVDNKIDRDRLRGSKYIQSKLGETYKNVRDDLESGSRVLFTGTSCQIAGLIKFLGQKYENLLCVDIVCHGVPSPRIWSEYLRWQEKNAGHKVVGVDFRNKTKFGWRDHIETLYLDNGKQIDSRVFARLFYSHSIIRPCCYECPFKSIHHPGDITIADYWGIENAAPEFDDNIGVSLVLVYSEKGEFAFEQVKGILEWKPTRIEDSMQPPLKAPFPKPEGREVFWYDFRTINFNGIAKKYGDENFVKKLKIKICGIKVKLLKKSTSSR